MTTPIVHRSPRPDVAIPDVAITPYVFERAPEHTDRYSVRRRRHRPLDHVGELATHVDKTAAGSARPAASRGRRARALMAPNLPEYAVVFHGVAFAGGVTTTINPTYTEREVHHQLLDAGARLLVTVPLFLETALQAAEGTSMRRPARARGGRGHAPARRRRPFAELLGAPLAEQVPWTPTTSSPCRTRSGTTGHVEGRHAHPPESGRERRAGSGCGSSTARGREDPSPSCRSSTSTACRSS